MKKFLSTILIILGLLFISRHIYKFYHENYLLDTEAVVNIYPSIPDEKVDDFFGLTKGTFDSKKHSITFSFRKFPGDELDYYYNLPIRNYNDLENLDCNESFSRSKHQRFLRNEIIDDGYLYVRLINNKYQNFTAPRKSKSILAIRIVPIRFTFGKINNIIVNSDNAIKYCP